MKSRCFFYFERRAPIRVGNMALKSIRQFLFDLKEQGKGMRVQQCYSLALNKKYHSYSHHKMQQFHQKEEPSHGKTHCLCISLQLITLLGLIGRGEWDGGLYANSYNQIIIQFKLLHEMQIENDCSYSDFDLSHEQIYASATKLPENQFSLNSSSQQFNFKSKKRGRRPHAQKSSNGHSKPNKWSVGQQLQYFYAVIKYSITYPFQSLSWGEWKQNRFYNYVSRHFSEAFGEEGAKTIKQCKTKDQNLKNKHYLGGKQVDLLELSRLMLQESVFSIKMLALEGPLSDEDHQRLLKYEEVLVDVVKLDSKSLSRTYDQELSSLLACIEQDMMKLEDLITTFP